MYGVEAYIARAIESVQQQKFKDWELIIVNDGTKDRSREIAAKYEQEDQRIRIIDKPNGGLTSARLKGLEIAQGEYLSFIDSDDTLQPDYLEVLYSNIVRHNADVCMCSYNIVNEYTTIPVLLCFPEGTTILDGPEIIMKDYFLPQIDSVKKNAKILPAFMWLRIFRRDVINTDFFISERNVYKEDLVFSAKILSLINKLVVVNIPLYNYFITPGSLTQKYRENARDMMESLTNEIFRVLDRFPTKLVEDRQRGHLLFSAHFTLKNASRQSYSLFLKEYQKNTNDELLKEIVRNTSLFSVPRGFLVMLLTMKIHCPLLLYKYLRKRI